MIIDNEVIILLYPDWHPKYFQVWGEEIRVPGPPIIVCKGDLVTVEVGAWVCLNQEMGIRRIFQEELLNPSAHHLKQRQCYSLGVGG